MRHRKRGRKLGRNSSHRHAMLRNMAIALFEHGQITATLAKAKELRPFAEKLITLARKSAAAYQQAEQLKEKASEHDERARQLLDEARRYGPDTERGQKALEQRRQVLQERYRMLQEWRKAVAPGLHTRRLLIARLGNYRLRNNQNYDTIIQKLVEEIGPRFVDRPGGYTRIVRLPKRRLGDATQLAKISLVTEPSQPKRKDKKKAKQAQPVTRPDQPAEPEQPETESESGN